MSRPPTLVERRTRSIPGGDVISVSHVYSDVCQGETPTNSSERDKGWHIF